MASTRTAPDATAPTRGERPRVWRRPLLIVHIVAAVSLIGTDLALLTLALSGLRGADPRSVYPAASRVASWVIGPLVVLALVTGIAQAALSRWGLARYWWVTIKLAVTVVFTGVVWAVLIPRLAASATAADAGQVLTAAERAPLAIVATVAIMVLLGLVTLAVYKPGGQIRATRHDPTTRRK